MSKRKFKAFCVELSQEEYQKLDKLVSSGKDVTTMGVEK